LPSNINEVVNFVKRKTDITISEEVKETKISTPIKNQFEEENIFLMTEEKKKKTPSKEGSDQEENEDNSKNLAETK
jgi:hypothetical protein